MKVPLLVPFVSIRWRNKLNTALDGNVSFVRIVELSSARNTSYTLHYETVNREIDVFALSIRG